MEKIKSCNLKICFVLFDATTEPVNLLLSFLKKSIKAFLQFDLPKKTLSSILKIYRNIYRR